MELWKQKKNQIKLWIHCGGIEYRGVNFAFDFVQHLETRIKLKGRTVRKPTYGIQG